MQLQSNQQKLLKQDFVSNLSGGPVWEIFLLTSIFPICLLIRSLLSAKFVRLQSYNLLSRLIDILLFCQFPLLNFTILSNYSHITVLGLFIIILLLFLLPTHSNTLSYYHHHPPNNVHSPYQSSQSRVSARCSHLSLYRGAMMLLTCFSILAVDFPIFPRRFAKVETWGSSFMDMGVGCFVFSGGLVSARRHYFQISLSQTIRKNIPLILLAFLRLLMVKVSNYAEHVSEYGVHWNFFLTLACLPFIIYAIDSITRRFRLVTFFIPGLIDLLTAIFIALSYQFFLNFTPLQNFILHAPRTSLFSQNREGIFSLIGYSSLFLAGRDAGSLIFAFQSIPTTATHPFPKQLFYRFLIWVIFYLLLNCFPASYSFQSSRRLVNFTYISLSSCFNLYLVILHSLVQTFSQCISLSFLITTSRSTELTISPLLSYFNHRSMLIFLLANVLTGLMNLTFSTHILSFSCLLSFTILSIYMLVLCLFAFLPFSI